MTFLSCKEIDELMTELGYTQTNTCIYAHEFKLKNGQYVYVKQLKDNQKRKNNHRGL
ncbi:hypothetical protein OHV48_13620 [Acinetobacter baumannii]|nr:hypothetical protein [Acinetobacter baumannii]